jgi:hypothetical protein
MVQNLFAGGLDQCPIFAGAWAVSRTGRVGGLAAESGILLSFLTVVRGEQPVCDCTAGGTFNLREHKLNLKRLLFEVEMPRNSPRSCYDRPAAFAEMQPRGKRPPKIVIRLQVALWYV